MRENVLKFETRMRRMSVDIGSRARSLSENVYDALTPRGSRRNSDNMDDLDGLNSPVAEWEGYTPRSESRDSTCNVSNSANRDTKPDLHPGSIETFTETSGIREHGGPAYHSITRPLNHDEL